ncbi:chloride channel protein [Parashewanella curva]|uniref:Chloride channel protein n=1 Tax=Parashewanella curva TaxID=2338552 RepID=A0A3L8Q2F4_9GAMM|nr:chloride channel protein [Parashewanella curva]RLV61734.1 chloride channel protein [Parashewanella curva]
MHSTIKKLLNKQSSSKVSEYFSTEFRDLLSGSKTNVQLCLLALAFAIVASSVIILFRWLLQASFEITELKHTDFVADFTDWRSYLPLLGVLLIWFTARLGSKRYKQMGIAYVLHRYKLYYGKIPLPSAPGQFLQALFALATNFSVGREGPAIHLGAVSASVMAEKFNLPDNSVRILSASGVAAGIAATFNAPLGAVIFVFEVIIREYRIHYFFPILISAVCGAMSSQLVFGDIHEFDAITINDMPLNLYPALLADGLLLGCFAALLNSSLLKITEVSQQWPLLPKLFLAGVVTTIIGMLVPQALGSDGLAIMTATDTSIGMTFLLVILFAKTIATVSAIGLGIPGGLIGPLYGIGAMLGAILAEINAYLIPESAPYIGTYTIIGMTVMMGVCLNAPLAALVALLELTYDANILLPAMFVMIPAFLLAFQGFNCRSILLRQLDMMGLGYRVPPLNLGLQKRGVRAVMEKEILILDHAQFQQSASTHCADGSLVLIKTDDGNIHQVAKNEDNAEVLQVSSTPLKLLPDTATLDDAYHLLAPSRSGEIAIYQKQTCNIVGLISWNMIYKEVRKGHV